MFVAPAPGNDYSIARTNALVVQAPAQDPSVPTSVGGSCGCRVYTDYKCPESSQLNVH